MVRETELTEARVVPGATEVPSNLGGALGRGEGYWPCLEEARDVSFTPKTGRCVCFEWPTSCGSCGPYGCVYDGMLVIEARDGGNNPTVFPGAGCDGDAEACIEAVPKVQAEFRPDIVLNVRTRS